MLRGVGKRSAIRPPSGQSSTRKPCAYEPSAAEVSAFEPSFREVGALEVASLEIGTPQICGTEVDPRETAMRKIGIREIGQAFWRSTSGRVPRLDAVLEEGQVVQVSHVLSHYPPTHLPPSRSLR